MAEEEKKKKVKRADGSVVTVTTSASAKDEGSAVGYRIGAAIAWLFAIGFEVVAVLILFGKINLTFMPTLAQLIIALVLDLACVITGSLLWKKSNRIDPASKKNKVKFWLWNNMGLIVSAFAFIPFVILALTNKDTDKKTKTIATVVAVIALLIGGLVGVDWNPISEEEKQEAINAFGDDTVFWTQFGTVYHTSLDCGHLNHSDDFISGTVEEAIQANKTRLCKSCEARDADPDEKGPEAADTADQGETEADTAE